jgi:hypothetical protein
MATIKLQPSGAVVIKDGKVSCECCDTECCLYPAKALEEGLYTVDDLPDAILVTNFNFSLDNTIFTKTGNSGIFYTGTNENGHPVEVGLFTYLITGYTIWVIYLFGERDGLSSMPECLITQAQDEASATKDTFANSYSVNGPINGTVTRDIELGEECIWNGTGLKLTNFGYQWKVNGKNKIGFNNTPIGLYEGGYTVS